MSDILPTVRIVAPDVPGGYIVINESDFDATKHDRFIAPPPAAVVAVPPPPAAVVADPLAELVGDWHDSADTARLFALAALVSGGRSPDNRDQAVAILRDALAAKPAA